MQRKGGRTAAAMAARWGPRRVGSPGGERRAHRSGEGCPMGSPAGRQPRWGKAGAPKRRGLPGVQRRGSTSQAEAAPAVAEGQHESSGGRARRSGGSARVKRRGARRAGCGANGKGRQDKPICLSSGCNKDQDYLNLRLRAASDFFLRLTEGFS